MRQETGFERSERLKIFILIALGILAYAPSLSLPFIADDYPLIPLAHHYAGQGWLPLFESADLRPRFTYMLLSAGLDRVFGFTPLPFHAASIFLHIACVLAVYATCVWTEIGKPAAFCAAAFFAVQEGHQEAVMWVAAAHDMFVFLFGMAAWVCWVKWLQGGTWRWYVGALIAFLFALISKESVWIFGVLFLLPIVFQPTRRRRAIIAASPFLAIAGGYVLWLWLTRVASADYNDIRFSLSAPWGRVLLNSLWKILFPWGFAAVGVLWWQRRARDPRLISAALAWTILSLLPVCFLTYMTQVPSRHTYIATAGLAWLVGAALHRLFENRQKTALAIFAVSALVVNVEILWVKKMAQFRERGEPTELLKQDALKSDEPISVTCFPLPDFVVTAVVRSVGKTAVIGNPDTVDRPNCFSVDYRNRQGTIVHDERKLGQEKHGVFY